MKFVTDMEKGMEKLKPRWRYVTLQMIGGIPAHSWGRLRPQEWHHGKYFWGFKKCDLSNHSILQKQSPHTVRRSISMTVGRSEKLQRRIMLRLRAPQSLGSEQIEKQSKNKQLVWHCILRNVWLGPDRKKNMISSANLMQIDKCAGEMRWSGKNTLCTANSLRQ